MKTMTLILSVLSVLFTLSLASVAFAEEATPAKAADESTDDDTAAAKGTTLAAPGGAPAGLAVPLVSSSTTTVEEETTMTVTHSGPLPDCDTPECHDRRRCETDLFAKCWDADRSKCVCVDGYRWSGTLDRCITEAEWNERRAMQIAVATSRSNKEAIGANAEAIAAESARNDAQDETLADHDRVLRDHAEKLGDEIARGQIRDRKITEAQDTATTALVIATSHEPRLTALEGKPAPVFNIGLGGMFHARQGLGDPDEDGDIAVHRSGSAGYVMLDARFGALDSRTLFGVVGIVGAGLGPSVAADPDMMSAPAFMMYALGGPVIPVSRRVQIGFLGGFSFEATDVSNGDIFLSKSSNGVGGVELNVDLVGPVSIFARFLGGGGIANDLYEDEENDGEVMHRAARTYYIGLQAGVRFGPKADPSPPTTSVASTTTSATTSTTSGSETIMLPDFDD